MKIDEFDIQGLLRAELNKGRVHTALTRRLIAALRYMESAPRQQATLSLLENLETLAPVTPQVMLAAKSAVEDIGSPAFTEQVHAIVRDLIEQSHYITKIDLNLAYMVRLLSTHHSMANEQFLISLYRATHGFGSGQSILVQRDIILIMARWSCRYWLSDLKNYFATLQPWLKRAFLIASYALDDEGKHWRDAIKPTLTPLDEITRDWAAEKKQINGWQVPL